MHLPCALPWATSSVGVASPLSGLLGGGGVPMDPQHSPASAASDPAFPLPLTFSTQCPRPGWALTFPGATACPPPAPLVHRASRGPRKPDTVLVPVALARACCGGCTHLTPKRLLGSESGKTDIFLTLAVSRSLHSNPGACPPPQSAPPLRAAARTRPPLGSLRCCRGRGAGRPAPLPVSPQDSGLLGSWVSSFVFLLDSQNAPGTWMAPLTGSPGPEKQSQPALVPRSEMHRLSPPPAPGSPASAAGYRIPLLTCVTARGRGRGCGASSPPVVGAPSGVGGGVRSPRLPLPWLRLAAF